MWRHFTLDEFKCHHCGLALMQEEFVNLLDELREQYGKPLTVSSGFRCSEHNQAVSSTGPNGPHTTGRAADLAVDRQDAYSVLRLAFQLGFTGIGVSQKGASRFIHLDTLTTGLRPTVWSY